MREQAHHHWKRLPDRIRKPLVLVVGCMFVLAAAATGWLPGPGGIPLFLIGIAILASEFVWAEKFRDIVLEIIYFLGRQWRQHKVTGTLIFATGVSLAFLTSYWLFFKR